MDITGTSVGAANQIVSAGAVTYEAVPHRIEFYSPRVFIASAVLHLILRDGTTVLGTLGRFTSSEGGGPLSLNRRLTPTAASHTYNVAGWTVSAATHNVFGGTGGTAGDATTYLPGFIRIFRVPT